MLIEELQYLMGQQNIYQKSSVCKLRCKICNKIYTGQAECIFQDRYRVIKKSLHLMITVQKTCKNIVFKQFQSPTMIT